MTAEASEMTLGAAFLSPDDNAIRAGLDEEGRLWGWDGTPLPEGKVP